MDSYKKRDYVPLILDGNAPMYLISDDIKRKSEELEKFLESLDYMNTKEFSKKVLFGQEIKSNNAIEGYLDDINLVNSIIRFPGKTSNDEQRRRILNLYYGYQYILSGKSINKDNLKELYNILSKDLLSEDDLNNMGEYYRKNPVYIYYSDVLTKDPNSGVEASLVENKMNSLFTYLNDSKNCSSSTDYFIQSQIAHFYFVYIHPYYDINGRTGRTLGMWYLLNEEVYPYIIFNRAIQLDKTTYYKVIRDSIKYHNVTYFLNYMLNNVHVELEKEALMENIIREVHDDLTESEIQSLYYILSMNGLMTYYDFSTFYNRFNDKKKTKVVHDDLLLPLIDKGIIIPGRKTNTGDNYLFSLNEKIVTNHDSIKHLNLTNKLSSIK